MKNLNIGVICAKEKELEAYNIIHNSYNNKSLEKLNNVLDVGSDTNRANIGYFDDAHYTFMRLKIDTSGIYFFIGSSYDQILLIGSKEEISSFINILAHGTESSLFEKIITDSYVPKQYQMLTIEI